MQDPFELSRFIEAQAGVIDEVRAELRRGAKQTHWMWFVFPQLAGLGRSPTAAFFGIHGRAEAVAYLAHPLLGPRLVDCTGLVNAVEGRSAHQIFGAPDDLKFRSSMTLFSQVAEDAAPFQAALAKYFEARPDPETLRLLA